MSCVLLTKAVIRLLSVWMIGLALQTGVVSFAINPKLDERLFLSIFIALLYFIVAIIIWFSAERFSLLIVGESDNHGAVSSQLTNEGLMKVAVVFTTLLYMAIDAIPSAGKLFTITTTLFFSGQEDIVFKIGMMTTIIVSLINLFLCLLLLKNINRVVRWIYCE